MTSSWRLTAKLLQVLERHLRGYANVAAQDAALLIRGLQRRVLAAVLAVASGGSCLLLGMGWIAASAWNTPWRTPVLATMVVALAACAAVCAVLATRSARVDGRPFVRLRQALGADAQFINEMAAEDPLCQSRSEIAELFTQEAEGSDAFPRSMLMRLLLSTWRIGGFLKVFQHTD